MKIYIAGPMSHVPDQNRTAFIVVADQLQALGHRTINPIDHADPEIVRMADDLGPAFRYTPEYEQLLQSCCRLIEQCDGIFMLPGWGQSTGAKRELEYAKKRMKHVFYTIEQVGGGVMKWTGPEELGPSRTFVGDAGFDLYVARDTRVPVDGFVDVDLGISVEMPPGTWAMLTGRSSTIRRRRLLVTQGIIDNGYRGPLYAGVQNFNEHCVDLERGERIAQLIPFQATATTITPYRVAQLSDTDRGTSGFGSTGA